MLRNAILIFAAVIFALLVLSQFFAPPYSMQWSDPGIESHRTLMRDLETKRDAKSP